MTAPLPLACCVEQLARPAFSSTEGVSRGILTVNADGPFAGRTVNFGRHNLSVFGHDMAKADLMRALNFKDVVTAEVYEDGDILGVKWVWVGPRSSQRSNEADAAFSDWLREHRMDFSTFLELTQGILEPEHYFPFPQAAHAARVSKLFDTSEGAHCGVVTVTKGPLKGTAVLFQRSAVYLWNIWIGAGDLSYLFSSSRDGEKVMCELVEMSADERLTWQKRLGEDVPKHVATVVYVGSGRPRAHEPALDPLIVADKCWNLSDWLTKRGLEAGDLKQLIEGKLPPLSQNPSFREKKQQQKQDPPQEEQRPQQNQVEANERLESSHFGQNPHPHQYERQTGEALPPRLESERPPAFTRAVVVKAVPGVPRPRVGVTNWHKYGNVPKFILPREKPVEDANLTGDNQDGGRLWGSNDPNENPVIRQVKALVERIMSCATPEDPSTRLIVQNEEDFNLASFLSNTLDSGIRHFRDRIAFESLRDPTLDPQTAAEAFFTQRSAPVDSSRSDWASEAAYHDYRQQEIMYDSRAGEPPRTKRRYNGNGYRSNKS